VKENGMSNIITLGIMGALLIGGIFVLHHLLAGLHEKNSIVALGVDKGIPVSMPYRWVTLFQMVAPIVLFTGVLALLTGFTFLQIADSAEDAGISTLAQLCGWMFFVASFAALTMGPFAVLGLAATLRKSTRS
jgi:hypothetical protein